MNTDASFCHETKCGGYAFWIKTDHVTFKKFSWFKDNPSNPSDAEIKAIANGLHYLIRLGNVPKVERIIINTDSITAIKHISTPIDSAPILINKYIAELKKLTGAASVEFRHVKAHTKTGDKRSWVNDWCDKNAKICMRKKREEIKKNKDVNNKIKNI